VWPAASRSRSDGKGLTLSIQPAGPRGEQSKIFYTTNRSGKTAEKRKGNGIAVG